jgi:hypothetical protein
MSKEYDVPEEIQNLFAEQDAMEQLRNKYIERPFGFKKAKKCAISSVNLYNKAWRMFRSLYPEIKSSDSLSYSMVLTKVTILNGDEK